MMFYNVTFVLLTRDKLKGISISFTFLCISLALLFRSLYLPIILSPTNTSIFSNLYSCFTRSPSFSLLHHIILACPLPSIHNTPSLHPCLPKSLFNLILNTNTHTHTYVHTHTLTSEQADFVSEQTDSVAEKAESAVEQPAPLLNNLTPLLNNLTPLMNNLAPLLNKLTPS